MRFKAIVIILLVLTVGVLVGIGIVNKNKQVCEDVQIDIVHRGKDMLLTQNDVLNLLKQSNVVLKGTKQNEISKTEIESALRRSCWFDTLSNLTFKGDVLMMEVAVKHPFIQVYRENGDTYLIDEAGRFLPYSSKVKESLIVLNGNINVAYSPQNTVNNVKDKSLYEAYQIAQMISKDEFCRNQFSQIHINSNKEIELYGEIGRQVVLLGHVDNAAEKLENLKLIYKDALVYMGLNKYKQLDLRYKNRIVATKR